MRAIHSGNSFHIYDNSVRLYENLPPQVYRVDFDPRQGFSLTVHPEITIAEKVYGVHESKVDKVMGSFIAFERSLGVILSGDKGIGKSLFAKMLCQRANQQGFPVVICDACYPGIGQFLDSIDQPSVVLFDEFDKIFKSARNKEDEVDAQAALLSLFDGVSMNKKLFVVTCNDIRNLNDFLVNRPGRFHYHFRFDYPTKEEIELYMRDHLIPSKCSEIEKVVEFSRKVELNYDCLRAICFELTHCETFEEAISDLNILRPTHGQNCHCYLLYADGSRIHARYFVDLFSAETENIRFGMDTQADDDFLKVEFVPCNAVYSREYDGYYLPKSLLHCQLDVETSEEGTYFMKAHGDFVRSHAPAEIEGLLIKPIFNRKSIHYFSE